MFEIGIIGGGPAALFMYKNLVESGEQNIAITLFEKQDVLGPGMPYSALGAQEEHITNVSSNEIPRLTTALEEWVSKVPKDTLRNFKIDADEFNEFKVLPRLLFGKYLAQQFQLLLEQSKKNRVTTTIHFKTEVTDIKDDPLTKKVIVVTASSGLFNFDAVVICSGHNWKRVYEGKVPNWFDSPYPPSKLAVQINYPVGIRGASLTAIDAVRTLSRKNGRFEETPDGKIAYTLHEESVGFNITLHSLDGLLPAIRFHLEDPQLKKYHWFSEEELQALKKENNGFIPLEYLFEHGFKKALYSEHPAFYETIKSMNLEEFVAHVMSLRERLDPFVLFKAEYAEAEKSIRRRQSVYWKEMLTALNYALNYPAKHFCAEDMMRLKTVLMPLISIVIASVPQSSARELIALHEAGILSIVSVDRNSTLEPLDKGGRFSYTDENGRLQQKAYPLVVDAIGQAQFSFEDFPFKSLLDYETVSPALVKFCSKVAGAEEMSKGNQFIEKDSLGNYYLKVPGISINDNFQLLDKFGACNDRIYIMAVPYIGGLNPDYSGLDFCETASARIMQALANPIKSADAEDVRAHNLG